MNISVYLYIIYLTAMHEHHQGSTAHVRQSRQFQKRVLRPFHARGNAHAMHPGHYGFGLLKHVTSPSFCCFKDKLTPK